MLPYSRVEAKQVIPTGRYLIVLVNAIEKTEGMPHGAFALMETREEVKRDVKT